MKNLRFFKIVLRTMIACMGCMMFVSNAKEGQEDYYLIAGAFREKQHAIAQMTTIASKTEESVILREKTSDNLPLYVVEIEHLKNLDNAQKMQQQLSQLHIESIIKKQTDTPPHYHLAQSDVNLPSEKIIEKPSTPFTTESLLKAYQEASIHSHKPAQHIAALQSSLPDTPAAQQVIRKQQQSEKHTTPKHSEQSEKSDHNAAQIWNLRNADLRTVIQEVSRVTGINFLIDPRVDGKISIVSTKPMKPQELYQVFLSMLEISGYAALPSGKVTKIIPSLDAKTLNAPVYGRDNNTEDDEVMTRVIPIQYVSAQQLVPILRPLMPQWSSISAYLPTNTLIMSGRASNLSRMISIISRVDIAKRNAVEMLPLQNATAADVVKTLQSLQQHQQAFGPTPIALAADDRANAVLMSGSESERLRMRVLVSELDTPNPSGTNGSTQVMYLKFMQAKDIAPILAGVARSQFRGDVGVTLGTRNIDTPEKLDRTDGTDSADSVSDNAQNAEAQRAATSNVTKGQEGSRPHVEIIAEPNTNAVILNAPPSLMRTLKMVIAKLDIRPSQVAVEALIAEISEDDMGDLGIEWGTRGLTRNADNAELSAFSAGFGIIRQHGFTSFELQLHALAVNNKADILSTPSVVVLDNHLAHIKVGKEVSVKESDYPSNANGTTPATPYNTFKRVPVALILNVTPQITHDGSIKLLISHQNNTLQNPNQMNDNPVFNISEISTSVIINNGDILVLGGLIQNQLRDMDTKSPIVGDIPGLGQAFHHRERTTSKKKLMVFLRPIVLNTEETTVQVTGSKYEHVRDAQLDNLRDQAYFDTYKEHLLPEFDKPLELALPFIHHFDRQLKSSSYEK